DRDAPVGLVPLDAVALSQATVHIVEELAATHVQQERIVALRGKRAEQVLPQRRIGPQLAQHFDRHAVAMRHQPPRQLIHGITTPSRQARSISAAAASGVSLYSG